MEESIVSTPYIVLDPASYAECGDLPSNPQPGQPLTLVGGDGLPYPTSASDTLISWKCVDGILLCLQAPSSDTQNVTDSLTATNNDQRHSGHPPEPNYLHPSSALSFDLPEDSSSHSHPSAFKEEEIVTFSLDDTISDTHSELVTSTTTTLMAAASSNQNESEPTSTSSNSTMIPRCNVDNESIVIISDSSQPCETLDDGCEEKGSASKTGPSTIPGLSSRSLEERLACRDALMPPRRVRRMGVAARGGLSCRVCSRQFPSLHKMKKHVAICKGGTGRKTSSDELIEKHVCDLCHAEFPRPLLLHDHMSFMHNQERPFSCMHCPKKFYRSHDLKIHLNIHYNIKNYVCDVCGRQFNHLSNLKRHQRLHTGVCPYVCEICKQRFTQIVCLRHHLALHNKKSRTSVHTKRKKRKSYCQACGKTFDRKLDLDLHEKVDHSHGTFDCKSCMNSFSTLELLKNHSCTRQLLRKRHKKARKNREMEIISHSENKSIHVPKLYAFNNPRKASKEREFCDAQNISLELTAKVDSIDEGNEEATIKEELDDSSNTSQDNLKEVNGKELAESSSNVLEPLPNAIPQDSDTLVMYLTQGGESMAYVVKKKQDAVTPSVVASTSHPPSTTTRNSTGETILINVEDQHVSAGGEQSPHSPSIHSIQSFPRLFVSLSPTDDLVHRDNTENTRVRPIGLDEETASCEVEGITIKEEDIELEYGFDGEVIQNPDQISFQNDVCVHTIVSDISHELDDNYSELFPLETYASPDPTAPSSTAVGRGTRPQTSSSSKPNNNEKFRVSLNKKQVSRQIDHVKVDQDLRKGTKRMRQTRLKEPTKKDKHPTKNRRLQKNTKPALSCDGLEKDYKSIFDKEPSETDNKNATQDESNSKTPGKKEHRCSECGKTFNRRWNFNQHYSLHFPALNRYQCRLCPKSFAYRTTYTAHCASSHGQQALRFPCSQCNKVLGSSGALRAHERRVHQKLKPHACSLCPRTFHVKSELAYHLRLHRREQPYVCYACGRTFSHSSHLHRHERQHTGERPHRCQLCPQTFIQAVGLSTHMKKHHRQQPPGQQQLRPKPQPDAKVYSSSFHSHPTNNSQPDLTGTAPIDPSPNTCTVSIPNGNQNGEATICGVYNPTEKGIIMPILDPNAVINIDHIYHEMDLHYPTNNTNTVVAGDMTTARHGPQAMINNSNSLSSNLVFSRDLTDANIMSHDRTATLPHTDIPCGSVDDNGAAMASQQRGNSVNVLSNTDSVPVISILDPSVSMLHPDSAILVPTVTEAKPPGMQGASVHGEVMPNFMNVDDVYNIILWRN